MMPFALNGIKLLHQGELSPTCKQVVFVVLLPAHQKTKVSKMRNERSDYSFRFLNGFSFIRYIWGGMSVASEEMNKLSAFFR